MFSKLSKPLEDLNKQLKKKKKTAKRKVINRSSATILNSGMAAGFFKVIFS